jgi:predicted RND superfamily exporter protein
MFSRLALLLVRGRSRALFVAITAFLLVLAGGARLRADFSASGFFSSGDPESTYLASYSERWNAKDPLLLVLDGNGQSLLTKDRLASLQALVDTLDADPDVGAITSMLSMPRMQRGLGGAMIPIPLTATVPEAAEGLAEWQAQVLADPRMTPTFISADGRYASVLVDLEVDTDNLTTVRPVVKRIEADVAAVEAAGITVRVAGIPAVRADILDSIVRDQIIQVPAAIVLMAAMLWVLFRSRHGVLVPGIAAGVPALMLLGLMGWFGEPINLLNQTYLVLIPVIAVADAIHVVARFHEESISRAGEGALTTESKHDAIAAAMQNMGVACLLTSLTTVVGLWSLETTNMPVLRSFGWWAGIGVAIAWFTMLVIMPLGLSFTRDAAPRRDPGEPDWMRSLLDGSTRVAVRRPWTVLAASALVLAASAYYGAKVKVESRVSETLAPNHAATIGNRLVDEHLGGVLTYEVELTAPAGTFSDPKVIRALRATELDLAAHDEVRTSYSVGAVVAATSRSLGGAFDVSEDDATVAQVLGMLKGQPSLGSLVNDDASAARLLVRARDVGATRFAALGEEIAGEVDGRLAPLGIQSHLTGVSNVAYRGLSRATSDLRSSVSSTFVIIATLIGLLFRSPFLGFLSIIPNILPLAFGYGVMGLLGWGLDPAPAVVFAVVLGLSVDSTIHIFARWREEGASGLAPRPAIEQAMLHSGRAILMTTMILGVGFGLNTASTFPGNQTFGALGFVLVVSGWLSNLFVLPALLTLLSVPAADRRA